MKSIVAVLASIGRLFVRPASQRRMCSRWGLVRAKMYAADFRQMGEDVVIERVGELHGLQYISVGGRCSFRQGLFLTAWDEFRGERFQPSIEIGEDCHFGAWNHITAVNRIVIGRGCLTGKWVTITDNAHGDSDMESLSVPPAKRKLFSKGAVVIGDNVWMGDKVTILPGVTIGDGAVIAANAVVTRDVPAYSVAAGVPARIIKQIRENE